MKPLTLFVQPAILEQIDPRRRAKFLYGFADDLRQSSIAPSGDGGKATHPDLLSALDPELPTGPYSPADLAAFFASAATLPPRLLQALSTLETAAAPENDPLLDALIQRHIPNVAVNRYFPLDCALDLWFLAPQSLDCFTIASSSSSSPGTTVEVPIQDRDSSFARVPNSTVQGSAVQGSTVGISPELPGATNHTPLTTDHGPLTPDHSPIENQKSKIKNGEDQDQAALQALAHLSLLEYDRTRKQSARQLGIRVETLDTEVTRVRNQLVEDAMLQTALATLRSPEPWPEPVNGAEVLTQIVDRFLYYVIVPPGAPEAFTLWSAHAHCFFAFVQSPRLNICSPEGGCGKTTALDVIATLTPRALRTENLTAPVLFRLVHQYQPTLLLDEVDSWLPQAEELRGLLNAGHKRGACAYRCEGEGNAVRPFRAFGPAVLSGIGQLTGTLHDRSIVVPLMKAEAGQILHRFDNHRIEIETELCRKLARWTADNFAALKACEPPLPPTAFNRLADNWRPLFAIAQIAGSPWPELALNSFNHLAAPERPCAGGLAKSSPVQVGTLSTTSPTPPYLLTALRSVFHASAMERMTSRQIVHALRSTVGASGMDTCHITERWLAWSLKPLGIKPRNVQVGKSRAKGYFRKDFDSANGR